MNEFLRLRQKAREEETKKEIATDKRLNENLKEYLNNPKLKKLLLNGLPASNGFRINTHAADLFINKQQTLRKKKKPPPH